MMWLVTIASLIGTVANIYKQRWCFAVWFVTNCAWAGYDAWLGAWPQAVLMAIYAGLSVWGWFGWRAKGPRKAHD